MKGDNNYKKKIVVLGRKISLRKWEKIKIPTPTKERKVK